MAKLPQMPIIEVLPVVISITVIVNVAKPQLSVNSASTERPQYLVSHHVSCIGCAREFTHIQSIDHIDTQYG